MKQSDFLYQFELDAAALRRLLHLLDDECDIVHEEVSDLTDTLNGFKSSDSSICGVEFSDDQIHETTKTLRDRRAVSLAYIQLLNRLRTYIDDNAHFLAPLSAFVSDEGVAS